jgi:hypothetical protein
MRSLLLAVVVLASSSAVAEPLGATASAHRGPTYDLGVRIGGYGFRRDGDPRPGEGWTQCRMNGFGVFGARSLRGPMFVEAGVDMYSAADVSNPMDLPLDRTSGLFSAAIGVRTQIASWLRGYLQLGAGLELTKVSVPYGDTRIRDTQALPEGFFGAGAELKLFSKTHFGATMRANLMGTYDYDPARLDPDGGWVSAPTASEVFDPTTGVAVQGQFYVRREL